jgi:lipopolysaccharide biosynthesis glycosyltransferase
MADMKDIGGRPPGRRWWGSGRSSPPPEALREADQRPQRVEVVLARTMRALQIDRAVADAVDTPSTVVRPAAVATAQATMVRALTTGASLDDATALTVRALLARGQAHEARALAESMAERAEVSAVCLGLVAHRREWHALAVEEWSSAAEPSLAAWVPTEATESWLVVGDESARSRARALAVRDDLADAVRVDLAARLLVAGERDAARAALARVPAGVAEGLDEDHRLTWTITRSALDEAPVVVPAGSVAIGCLDYRQPDRRRSSGNVGDMIQTLAMLGHLARRPVAFSGDDGLGDVAREVQAEMPAELRLAGEPTRVHLVPVHRDVSSSQHLPTPVWTIAFGWHLHSLFGLRYDFPYHPAVRPLFVSFHLNRPDALTPQAVEYLRRYGPIGCRDWSTVYLLLGSGIDAFFTGCLTTTVDAAVAPVPRSSTPVTALVDAPPKWARQTTGDVEVLEHGDGSIRGLSTADGLRLARATLARYRSHYARVVTTRLHAYLPATSLGIPTTFVPANRADPRFAGLLGLEPGSPAFTQMRDDLRELLAAALLPVLEGAEEQAVYDRWRALTAPRVAQARGRHAEVAELPVPTTDVAAAVRVVHEERWSSQTPRRGDDYVDIAVATDRNLAAQLPVTIDALVGGASRPVRLWVLTRGLDSRYGQWLAEAFADVPVTQLPCDHVEYGDIGRMIEHITLSTMDRLLLPELLGDLDRITYVDVDALVLGDVVELAATDLSGGPVAARPSFYPAFLYWWKAAQLLPPGRADELRRRMTQHSLAGAALNAGILVLDLHRMREEGFTVQALAMAERYGFNDQDVLMAYTHGRRVPLDRRWNAWPLMERCDDPLLIHYVGAAKPWDPLLTPQQHRWDEQAARLRSRVSWPPPGGAEASGEA